MIPLILYIETSTSICSVVLARGEEIISIKEAIEANAHSAKLTVFIDEVFKESGIPPASIDAIAVGMGPGSYTGLRIGISTAKGLAYAINKPIIAINSLQTMAWGALNDDSVIKPIKIEKNALLLPMIDARRMEVYTATFSVDFDTITPTNALIIDENSYSEYDTTQALFYFGNGALKCCETFNSKLNMHFIDHIETSARYMITFGIEKFTNKEFEDTAYFEPFYLKDFIATKPKNKVF